LRKAGLGTRIHANQASIREAASPPGPGRYAQQRMRRLLSTRRNPAQGATTFRAPKFRPAAAPQSKTVERGAAGRADVELPRGLTSKADASPHPWQYLGGADRTLLYLETERSMQDTNLFKKTCEANDAFACWAKGRI
jgi:hypothetical protein